MPGNRRDMLDKALGLAPDAFLPDMEDSVPWDEKGNARKVTASALPRLAEAGAPLIPRVNSLDTGLLEDDLAAVVGPRIFGVSVGKIGSGTDIVLISNVIERLERGQGLDVGHVKLLPWIETASGVVNAQEICVASSRIVAVAFGAEDFTNDMGVERTDEESQIAYPRSAVSVAARAAGVLAVDTPFFSFRDPDGLRRDCLAARRYGFKGKAAIHPAQIEIINEAFSPSAREIDEARRVVEAFDEAERAGRGSTSLDGRVIDVPVVRRARSLLETAEAVGQGRG